jgi:hypothetical protein
MVSELIFAALVKKLEYFQLLSGCLRDAFLPLLEEVYMPKGDLLIKSGDRSNRLWFLHKGFAREIGHDEMKLRKRAQKCL